MPKRQAKVFLTRNRRLIRVVLSLAVMLTGTLTGSVMSLRDILPAAATQLTSVGTWFPAGPQMSTELISTFASEGSEFFTLQSGSIDLMDQPLTMSQIGTICPSPSFNCTFPVGPSSAQFAYPSNWVGVVDAVNPGASGSDLGAPNFFSLLNMYSPNPAAPGAIRWALNGTTQTLNPYVFGASTDPGSLRESRILRQVYDTIYSYNPMCSTTPYPGLAPCPTTFQILDWMTSTTAIFNCNGLCTQTQLGYSSPPPPGTVAAVRNQLWSNMHWQDPSSTPVTAWDVAFSYNTLISANAPQVAGIKPLVAGASVLTRSEFDIDLSTYPITDQQLLKIGSTTIIPGHLWSVCGATTWNDAIVANNVTQLRSCVGTTTSGTSHIGPSTSPGAFAAPTFDPVTNGMLIGSGPWTCQNTGANTVVPVGTVGTGCSSNNTDNPPCCITGAFQFTRYGCTLTMPGTPPSCVVPASVADYFHGSGGLAAYAWSRMTGVISQDTNTLALIGPGCLFKNPPPSACSPWTQGIDNPSPVPSGSGACPCPVGFQQFTSAGLYFGRSFIEIFTSTSGPFSKPYGWDQISVPGIETPFPIPLHQVGSNPSTLLPASSVGCAGQPYPFGNGYDC